MKRLILLVVGMALAVAPVLAQDAAKPKAVDITGSWEMTVESPQGTMVITANSSRTGRCLTGTHVSEMGEAPLKGTVKGADVGHADPRHGRSADVESCTKPRSMATR